MTLVHDLRRAAGRQVFGDAVEAVALGEPLGRRTERRSLEPLDGALRRGVEAADGVDLRTKELDAQRLVALCPGASTMGSKT
jgi:hypothetical protein